MTLEKHIPVIRDLVSLVAGTYVFITEALGQARWEPMLLGILFTSGPAAITAYWSYAAPTRASGSSGSSPGSPSSSSPPSPLPSSPAGEP